MATSINKKNVGSVSSKISKETKEVITKKKIGDVAISTPPVIKTNQITTKTKQKKDDTKVSDKTKIEKQNNIIEPPKVDLKKPKDTEDDIILNDEVLLRDSNVEKIGEEKILRMSNDVVIDSTLKRHESGYIISNDDYTEENKSYLNIALVSKRYYKKSYESIIDAEIRELT